MAISNTLKFKGLYTYGNELTPPEGSLRVADNVNIDEPNVISKRRGFSDFSNYFSTSTDSTVRQLMSYKNTPIAYFDNSLYFYNIKTDNFDKFHGNYFEISDDIRFKYAEVNGNFYFTTSDSIKKISALNASQFSTESNYITNAGVSEALDGEVKIVYNPSGFLPPQSKAAYKILFGKKDINNVLNLGASTARMVAINSSKDVFTYEKTNLVFKEDEDFQAQKTSMTCPDTNKIKQNSISSGISDAYILLENAKNQNKIQIYFKKDVNAIAPTLVPGAVQLEVDISTLTTALEVAEAIELVLINNPPVSITFIRSNNIIIFTNTEEGISNGVTFSPNVGTTAGAWTKIDLVVGTESHYIEKYFVLHSDTDKYCIYYGNSRTIDNLPSDPSIIGHKFIPILIANTSSKSFIANQTSIIVGTALSSILSVALNVSASNPIIQITYKLGGNLTDDEQGTLDVSSFEVIVLNQGSISKGQNANVEVIFTVPQGIDTTYFYRIYRTSFIQVDEGLVLDDIDPGEECNLVYEGSVTTGPGSSINVLDITNETFRNSGEYLYNNPITGDGILQNNYIPPVARDITVYKNYTFYANTKLQHQITNTVVSVDNLVNGISKFNISKGSTTKSYTFTGQPLSYTLTTPDKASVLEHNLTNPNAKLYVYSAMDLTKYVIYFDKGSATIPVDNDAIALKVDLTEISNSTNISSMLLETLTLIGDFIVADGSVNVSIINNENGLTTHPTTPTASFSDLGVGFGLSITQEGTGEDLVDGNIFLSNSPSVGLKIERTIRSLVRVLNADMTGFVNAYYLSGQNDLPGKYLLKLRTNEDTYFYITITDGNGSDFNPEIPSTENDITSIVKDDDYVIITVPNHEFLENEEVYFNLPDSLPNISNIYSVSVIDSNNVKILNPDFMGGDSNNSFYFFPFEKSDNLYSPNRIYYSKYSQPEAVPLVNYFDVGSKDSPIERILALRDYMFVLKTDGVYIVSGDAGQWMDRMQDTEIILCPDSAVILNNQIYMVTNSGVVTINETTPIIISRMIENVFSGYYNYRDLVRKLGFGVSYRDDRAYIFWMPGNENDTSCTQAYRYNYLEQEWTRWTTGAEASCGLVIGAAKTDLYIGSGSRSIIMKERKKLENYKLRIDYCDRDFQVDLGVDAVIENKYRLSSLEDVEVNDTLIQIQFLNIQFFNRFLKKLDTDDGIPYNNFVNDYTCKTGNNLADKYNQLNVKLIDIDTKGTIQNREASNTDWVELQHQFNLLMGDLNVFNSMSVFQDYDLSEGTIEYEYIITNANYTTNEVLLNNMSTEFIQGRMTIYKHIESVIETNPIHFGNPSSFKQVRQGYLLVDQNNYYKMKLEYSTDLSQYFEGNEYFGRNPGYWNFGEYNWKDHNYFGGDGSDSPRRTFIPRNKQRCRYISVKITHSIARDRFRLVGVAHDVREFSGRAYR